jgi:hypothetical protein
MFWMYLFFGSFSFLLVRLGSVSARLGFYTLLFEISALTPSVSSLHCSGVGGVPNPK